MSSRVVVARDGADGSLVLTSPLGGFGDDGAYLVLVPQDRTSAFVRRVPLAERFVVGPDIEGVPRTDHALDLGTIPVIRLHYRLEKSQRVAQPSGGR